MYPEIERIEQVLPAIEGRADFAIKRGDGYTSIDYLYTLPDTFDDPMRRECRGIKFGPDGKLIARPFAKFFNIGERPETQPHLIDVSLSHVVTEKLDGSMIHPMLLDGELVFATRMGVTEIAQDALAFASERVRWLCRACLESGLTPIFEWTGPGNRIVIRYRSPALTLLAVRDNRSGVYVDDLPGEERTVARVAEAPAIRDLSGFIAATRALVGAEGFVIRFESGLMLKLKADDYVLRHKAKEDIGLEKNALRAVLEGADDDLRSLLPQEDAEALEKYASLVRGRIDELMCWVTKVVGRARSEGADRKAFALQYVPQLPKILHGAAFTEFTDGDSRAALVAQLLKQTGSGTKVETIREAVGLPVWELP